MNFLATGWRELERKVQRMEDRLRLWLERRKLTAAEIRLGELGWQQVDFPPEVEAQIQAITRVEHQQAQFSNQSAEIQSQIEELQSRRRQEQLENADAVAAIGMELTPLQKARELARRPLAGLQEGVRRFEEAIAAARETRATLEAHLMELQAATPSTIEIQHQIAQVKDKRIASDFQIEDLRRGSMKLQDEINAQTRQIAALDLKIQEINRRISDEWEAFNAADKELLAEMAALQRGKRETGKRVEMLDKEKSSAFLAVGQCLADFDIAPMNQPDALREVLTQREIVRHRRQRIAASLETSSQTSRRAVIAFYIVIVLFLIALIAAAFRVKAPHHAAAGKSAAGSYAGAVFPMTRAAHSPMIAVWAATRWSSANSDGVSMVNVRLE